MSGRQESAGASRLSELRLMVRRSADSWWIRMSKPKEFKMGCLVALSLLSGAKRTIVRDVVVVSGPFHLRGPDPVAGRQRQREVRHRGRLGSSQDDQHLPGESRRQDVPV